MPVPADWHDAAAALARQRIHAGDLREPTAEEVVAWAAAAVGVAPSHASLARWRATPSLNAVAASVFRQQYVTHVKESWPAHRTGAARRRYARAYASNESLDIVGMAARERVPPYLLAKLLVEELGVGANGEGGGSDSTMTSEQKRKAASRLLRAPSLIADARLRRDAAAAVAVDRFVGPLVDAVRAAVGTEHEALLERALTARGLPFLTEKGLRDIGAPKTPDIRLSVPIGVLGPGGRPHVVHWIDSKAAFGDEESHAANMKQFTGYVNREGPGLVIYWFDHVETLDAMTPPDILVLDHLPGEFVLPGTVPGDAAALRRHDEVRSIAVEEIVERVKARLVAEAEAAARDGGMGDDSAEGMAEVAE